MALMGKSIYRILLLAVAFVLLLLDKSLMVFEVRSGWEVGPEMAVIFGALSAGAAVCAVIMAVQDEH